MYRPPQWRGENSLTAVNNRTGEINDPHAAVVPAAPPGGRQYPEKGCGKQIAGGVGLNWWEWLARLTGYLRVLADAGDAGEAGQLRLEQLLLPGQYSRHLAVCCTVDWAAVRGRLESSAEIRRQIQRALGDRRSQRQVR